MTTTCGAYHLEALRRQQVLDRKQVALQRLAQKEVCSTWVCCSFVSPWCICTPTNRMGTSLANVHTPLENRTLLDFQGGAPLGKGMFLPQLGGAPPEMFGMSWDNPFHPDLRPDVLLQDGQPWSPDMTESPKPFSPDMGHPTTADMMPQGGPMDGPPMLGPSGGSCDSPNELVQPDGGMCHTGEPRFIDVPKSTRNGSRLGTPPSRAGSGMPGCARSGSAAPFSPIMDDGEGGRADSQMSRSSSEMSEPVVPPNLQQAARAAGAAEEQARSAEQAARLEQQRRERIEAKHRAQQEHLAALSGGEKRKSHKKDRRTEHLTRQVLSLTPTDQKRLYGVLKEEMSKSARAKSHGHKNYRTQEPTKGVHPAVIHDLKKKEKLLRDNNLTMGHWSDYVD
uniref:Uncharacterized protein n=1 Tax=Branchiostoma floridae TaxID=7739 RepID=C3Z5S5_BRAFL|eukprot:XP_002596176.1 hypothetical protein BRAFLDRAFT_66093 [Branchiostoma floridae]